MNLAIAASRPRSAERSSDRERLCTLGPLPVACAVGACALLAGACAIRNTRNAESGTTRPTPRFHYEDMPKAAGFPAPEYLLERAVLEGDLHFVRRHAWSLWAGVTSRGVSTAGGEALPIFQTWYSIPEVFSANGFRSTTWSTT